MKTIIDDKELCGVPADSKRPALQLFDEFRSRAPLPDAIRRPSRTLYGVCQWGNFGAATGSIRRGRSGKANPCLLFNAARRAGSMCRDAVTRKLAQSFTGEHGEHLLTALVHGSRPAGWGGECLDGWPRWRPDDRLVQSFRRRSSGNPCRTSSTQAAAASFPKRDTG
jgi:hypothetical protein